MFPTFVLLTTTIAFKIFNRHSSTDFSKKFPALAPVWSFDQHFAPISSAYFFLHDFLLFHLVVQYFDTEPSAGTDKWFQCTRPVLHRFFFCIFCVSISALGGKNVSSSPDSSWHVRSGTVPPVTTQGRWAKMCHETELIKIDAKYFCCKYYFTWFVSYRGGVLVSQKWYPLVGGHLLDVWAIFDVCFFRDRYLCRELTWNFK